MNVTKPGHNSFLTLLIKISMFQHFGTTHFLVFNTGVVLWVPPAKFRAFCKVATILLIPSATFSMATKILQIVSLLILVITDHLYDANNTG